ncbi:hypothetical protein QFC20_000340 [Naganishia adeliensis]|uniref:Uncharacterized protein n=1 Tax=Naganishia adeliensis TaxID=92952 RepID=A0ACC2X1A8_9TREE|nr:hypothetical protein QFC20_000340 [Naganishia adeliensis]
MSTVDPGGLPPQPDQSNENHYAVPPQPPIQPEPVPNVVPDTQQRLIFPDNEEQEGPWQMEEDTDPYLNFFPFVTLKLPATPDIPNDATPLTGEDRQVPPTRHESQELRAMPQAVVLSDTPQRSRLDILTDESPLNAEELHALLRRPEVLQRQILQPAQTTSIEATPAPPSLLGRLADPAPLDQAMVLALFNRPEFLENRNRALAVLGVTVSDVPSDRILTTEEVGHFVRRPEFNPGGESRAALARALVDANARQGDAGSFRSLVEHIEQSAKAEKQAEEQRQAVARASRVGETANTDTSGLPLREQWKRRNDWHKFNKISEDLIAQGFSGLGRRPCPPEPSGPEPGPSGKARARPNTVQGSIVGPGPSSAASKRARLGASTATKAKLQTATKTTIPARGSSHAVTRNGKLAVKGKARVSGSTTVQPASAAGEASGSGTTTTLTVDSAGPATTATQTVPQPGQQPAPELGGLAMAFGSLGLAATSLPPPQQLSVPSTGIMHAPEPQVASRASPTSAKVTPSGVALAKAKARAALTSSGVKTEIGAAGKGKGRAAASTTVIKTKATQIKKPGTQSSNGTQVSQGTTRPSAKPTPVEPAQTSPQAGSSRTAVEVLQTARVPRRASPSGPSLQNARSSALPYDRSTRPAPTSRSPTPPRSSVSSGIRSQPTGSSVAGSSGVSVAQGRAPLAAVTAPSLSVANSANSLDARQKDAKFSKTNASSSSAKSQSSSTSVVAHPLGPAVNQETADCKRNGRR